MPSEQPRSRATILDMESTRDSADMYSVVEQVLDSAVGYRAFKVATWGDRTMAADYVKPGRERECSMSAADTVISPAIFLMSSTSVSVWENAFEYSTGRWTGWLDVGVP